MGESKEKKEESSWSEELGTFFKDLINKNASGRWKEIFNRLRVAVGLKTKEELGSLKDELNKAYDYGKDKVKKGYENVKDTAKRFMGNTKEHINKFKEKVRRKKEYYKYYERASKATGVPLYVIWALQAQENSTLNPNLKNPNSSAGGIGQFLSGSWASGVNAANKYGLGEKISGEKLDKNPETRFDAESSIYATVASIRKNIDKWNALPNFTGVLASKDQVGKRRKQITNMILERIKEKGGVPQFESMNMRDKCYVAYFMHRDGPSGGILRLLDHFGYITTKERKEWGWPASRGRLDDNMENIMKPRIGRVVEEFGDEEVA